MPPKRRKRLAALRNQEVLRSNLKTTSRIKKRRNNNARKKKENDNKLKSSPNRSKNPKNVNPNKSKAKVLRCLDFTDFTISFCPDETSNDSEQYHSKVFSNNANLPKKTTHAKNQPRPSVSPLATRSKTSNVSQPDSNRSTKRKFAEIEVDDAPANSTKKVAVLLSASSSVEKRRVRRNSSSSSSVNTETEIFEKTLWAAENSSSRTFVKKLFSGSDCFTEETLPIKTSPTEIISNDTRTNELFLSKTFDKIQPRKKWSSHSSDVSEGDDAVSVTSLSDSSTDEILNAQIKTFFDSSPVKTETNDENPSSSESTGEEKAKSVNTRSRACARKSTSKTRKNLRNVVETNARAEVDELKVIDREDDAAVIKNVTPCVAEDLLAQKTLDDDKAMNICQQRTHRNLTPKALLMEQLKDILGVDTFASPVTNSITSAEKSPSLYSSDSEKKIIQPRMGCIVYVGCRRPVHPAVYDNLKMPTSDLKIDSNWAKIAASAVQVPNRPPTISRFLVPIVYKQLEDLALKHFSTNCSRVCNSRKQSLSHKSGTTNDRIPLNINEKLEDNVEQADDESCCFHAGVGFLNDLGKAKNLSCVQKNLSETTCRIAPSEFEPVENPKNRYIQFEKCTDSASSCDTSIDSKLELYSCNKRLHNPDVNTRSQLNKKPQLNQVKSDLTKSLQQKWRTQKLAQVADSQKINEESNDQKRSRLNVEPPKRFLRSGRKAKSFTEFAMNRRIAPTFEDESKSESSSDIAVVNPVPSKISSNIPKKLFSLEKPYEFTIKMSKIGQTGYQSVLNRKQATPIFSETSNSTNDEDSSVQKTSESPLADGVAQVFVSKTTGQKRTENWRRQPRPLSERDLRIVSKQIEAKAKKAEFLMSRTENESDVKSVVEKIINYVSEKEIQDSIEIDYDDDFCPHSSDETTMMEDCKISDVVTPNSIAGPSERKDRCTRELKRLNVNVIKLQDKAENEPTPSESSGLCLKESCKLGCICLALCQKTRSNLEHCSQEPCIFGCVCGSDWRSVKSSTETPSILTPLLTKLQVKSSKSLAVKEFRETVFMSCDNTSKSEIFLNNTKRRNRKLPKKFEDHVIEVGLSFPNALFPSNSVPIDDPDNSGVPEKIMKESCRIEGLHPRRLAKKSSSGSLGTEDQNLRRMAEKSSVEGSKVKAQKPIRFGDKYSVETARGVFPTPTLLAEKPSTDNNCSKSTIEESNSNMSGEKSSMEGVYIEPKQLKIGSPSKTLRVVLESLADEPRNIFCMVHNRRNCLCLPQIHSKYGIHFPDEMSPGILVKQQSEPLKEEIEVLPVGSSARTGYCTIKLVARNKEKNYLISLLNQEHQRSSSLFFKACAWHAPEYGQFKMQNLSLKQLIHFIKYCKKSLSYSPTLCDLLRASLQPTSSLGAPSHGSTERYSDILGSTSYEHSSIDIVTPESDSGSSEVPAANTYFECDSTIISNVCSIAPEEFEKLGQKENQDSTTETEKHARDNNLPEEISTPFENGITESSSSQRNWDSSNSNSLSNILVDLLPVFKDRHQWFIFDLLQDFELVKISIRSNTECVLQKCLKRQLFDKMCAKAQLRNKTIRYSFEHRLFSAFAIPGLPSLIFFGPFMRHDSMNLMPLKKSSPTILRMVPLKEIFIKYKLPRTQTVYDFTLVHQEIKSATEELLIKCREPFIYYYFWEPLQNLSQKSVALPLASNDDVPTESTNVDPTKFTNTDSTKSTYVDPRKSTDADPTKFTDAEPTKSTDADPTKSVAASASSNDIPELNLPASSESVLQVEAAPPLSPDTELHDPPKKRKPMPKSKRLLYAAREHSTPSKKGEVITSGEEKCRHILRIEAEHSYVSSFSGKNPKWSSESSSSDGNSGSHSSVNQKKPEFNTKSTESSLERKDSKKTAVCESEQPEKLRDIESNMNNARRLQTLSETKENILDPAPPGFVSKYLLCSVKEVGYVDIFASTTSSLLIANLSYMELNFDDITQASEWLNNTLSKCLIFYPVDFKPQWRLVDRFELPKKCKVFDPQRLSNYTFLTEEGPKAKEAETVTSESDTDSTISAADDFEGDMADVCNDDSEDTLESEVLNGQEPECVSPILDEQNGLLCKTNIRQSNLTETDQFEKAKKTNEIKDYKPNHHPQTGESENSLGQLKTKELSVCDKDSTVKNKTTNNPQKTSSENNKRPEKIQNLPTSNLNIVNSEVNNQPITTEPNFEIDLKDTGDSIVESSTNTDAIFISPGGTVKSLKLTDTSVKSNSLANAIVIDAINPKDSSVNDTQEKSKSEAARTLMNPLMAGEQAMKPADLLKMKKVYVWGKQTSELTCSPQTTSKTTISSNTAINENNNGSKSRAQTLSHDGNNASPQSTNKTAGSNNTPISNNNGSKPRAQNSSHDEKNVSESILSVRLQDLRPTLPSLMNRSNTNLKSSNNGQGAVNSVISQKFNWGNIMRKLPNNSTLSSIEHISKPGVDIGNINSLPSVTASSINDVGNIDRKNSAAESVHTASNPFKTSRPQEARSLNITSAKHSSSGTDASFSNHSLLIPISASLVARLAPVSNSRGPPFMSTNHTRLILKPGSTGKPQIIRIESTRGTEERSAPRTIDLASSIAPDPPETSESSSEEDTECFPFNDSNKFQSIVMPDGRTGHTHAMSPPSDPPQPSVPKTPPVRKQLKVLKPVLSLVAQNRAAVLQNALREVNRCSREREQEEKEERRIVRRRRRTKTTGKEGSPEPKEQPNKKEEKGTSADNSGEDEGNPRRSIRKKKETDPDDTQEEKEETSRSESDQQTFKSSGEKLLKERKRRRELYALAQDLLSVSLENTLDADYPSSSSMSLQAVLKLAMLAIDKQKVESEMMMVDHSILQEKNTALRQRLLALQTGCVGGAVNCTAALKNHIVRTFISETDCFHEKIRQEIRTRNEKVLRQAMKINTFLKRDPYSEEWKNVKNLIIRVPSKRKTRSRVGKTRKRE